MNLIDFHFIPFSSQLLSLAKSHIPYSLKLYHHFTLSQFSTPPNVFVRVYIRNFERKKLNQNIKLLKTSIQTLLNEVLARIKYTACHQNIHEIFCVPPMSIKLVNEAQSGYQYFSIILMSLIDRIYWYNQIKNNK